MIVDLKELTIHHHRYSRFLLVVAVSLVCLHLALHIYHHKITEVPWLLQQLFELDEENNLPTWFSSFLLLNCAALLYLQSIQKATLQKYWFTLALGFLVLSIDEVAGLHETLNTAIEISWAIPGAILVGIVGLLFIPFMLALPRRLAVLFFLSGFLYVSGAIGVELLSQDMDEDSLAYGFATAIEEGMEMLGAWLFLAVNLKYLHEPP